MMFKSGFFLLLTILFSLPSLGQPKYEVNWKTDGVLNGIGILILSSTIFTTQNVQTLTVEEINLLDRNDINSFDRDATYNYSKGAKTGSDVLLYSSLLLPILPLINKRMKEEQNKILLMYFETLLLNFGITQLMKTITLRTRPFVYNENAPLSEKLTNNARYSFYSGHASTVSSLTFLTASIINQYYPKGKFMPVIWSAAALIPLATGYLRIKSGRHFPTDVMVGYATGALIGLLIPSLHRIKKLKENGVSIQFGPNFMVMRLKI